MTDRAIWDKPISVPEHVIGYVDEAVKQSMCHLLLGY